MIKYFYPIIVVTFLYIFHILNVNNYHEIGSQDIKEDN